MSRRRHRDENDEQQHKRRRTSETVEVTEMLEYLISTLGEESSAPLESNVDNVTKVFEAHLPNFKSKILRLLCTVYVCKRFMDLGDDALTVKRRKSRVQAVQQNIGLLYTKAPQENLKH